MTALRGGTCCGYVCYFSISVATVPGGTAEGQKDCSGSQSEGWVLQSGEGGEVIAKEPMCMAGARKQGVCRETPAGRRVVPQESTLGTTLLPAPNSTDSWEPDAHGEHATFATFEVQ